jgi:hypothetical protein
MKTPPAAPGAPALSELAGGVQVAWTDFLTSAEWGGESLSLQKYVVHYKEAGKSYTTAEVTLA